MNEPDENQCPLNKSGAARSMLSDDCNVLLLLYVYGASWASKLPAGGVPDRRRLTR